MRPAAREAGFGLVEILAAIGLFSVVAVAVSSSVVTAAKRNQQGRSIAVAAGLIQNQMEKLRGISPVSGVIPADLTMGLHQDPLNPISSQEASGGTYTRTWNVTGVPQTLSGTVVGNVPGVAAVEVVVTWTVPYSGRMSASTYVCLTPTCGSS